MLATLLVFLVAAFPVMAAPRSDVQGQFQLADHIDPADCDTVTLGAGGEILVEGVALTGAQLALLDAEMIAALEYAAAAAATGNAEVCVDVALGEGDLVTVNAHVDLCSVDLEVGTGGEVLIDGVAVDPGLFGAELTDLLLAAAEADAEACVSVTIEDNNVFTEVLVTACVTATLNDDGSVTVLLGGSEFELPDGAVIDVDGELELGVAVEVGIEIYGALDVTAEELFIEAQVIVLDACGEVEPSLEPSASVDASASVAPSASAAPTTGGSVGGLPTANLTLPPTDGSVATGEGSAQLVLPIAVLLLVAGGLLLHGRRHLAR